ncbi:synaptic vesicle glycoprotein 2B-like isoform X2 [Thrips palmi]|uniref:Synaptic vesicle glycoprotein 2B-like isoform X2 n=1 Tax=Thrips palmi TaxID=161013 RepID=A0A6P8YJ42_THRPL|nr:synaptic vesicle glycoprotein 2B-like isoform X2 [Thrips palmi]
MKRPIDVIAVGADQAHPKKEKNEPEPPATYETAIVACGFGKFHYMLLLGLIPMCAAQLFSSGSVGLALPSAQCDLQLEDFQKGALNGATYLGNLMSGLVWGGVSDVFGRRNIIVLCFLADFLVSLACGFATSYEVLLVLKVLAGVIIAGPNSVLFAYLAEVNDNEHRSMSIMMNGMGFAFAQILQPVLAYFLLPLTFRLELVPGVMELTSWRVFFLACAVPSLVSGLMFIALPESPKFLMSKGRHEDALRAFERIYATNTGCDPATYPIKSLDICVAPILDGKKPNSLQRAVAQFSPLFRKPFLARMLLLVALQVNIMICINSLRLWTPQLFAMLEQFEVGSWQGKPEASNTCQMISAVLDRPVDSAFGVNGTVAAEAAARTAVDRAVGPCEVVSGDVYLRSVLVGAVGTTSFVFTGWASKRFGNRPLMLGSFPLAMVTSVGMLWAVDSDMFTGLLAVFTPLTAVGLTSLSAILVDLFPTSLRGVSVSVALICGRAASLSGNLILPVLLNISCDALFIFITVCLAVCSVLVWFVPKKKDVDL